jgi:hypothetical protein
MSEPREPTLLELRNLWDKYEKCTGSYEERNKMLHTYAMSLDAFGRTLNATLHFRKSAETCPDAMFEMGKRYSSGKGITCDGGCAEHWFTRAANGGHDGAKKELERRAAKKAQVPSQTPPQP